MQPPPCLRFHCCFIAHETAAMRAFYTIRKRGALVLPLPGQLSLQESRSLGSEHSTNGVPRLKRGARAQSRQDKRQVSGAWHDLCPCVLALWRELFRH
jgi:hypothetical protein